MLLIKIIGFVQLKQKFIEKSDLNSIIEELNFFFEDKAFFNEDNIILLGKTIIDLEFPKFLNKMLSGTINPELSITEDILNRINENLQIDKKKWQL